MPSHQEVISCRGSRAEGNRSASPVHSAALLSWPLRPARPLGQPDPRGWHPACGLSWAQGLAHESSGGLLSTRSPSGHRGGVSCGAAPSGRGLTNRPPTDSNCRGLGTSSCPPGPLTSQSKPGTFTSPRLPRPSPARGLSLCPPARPSPAGRWHCRAPVPRPPRVPGKPHCVFRAPGWGPMARSAEPSQDAHPSVERVREGSPWF